MTEVEAREHLTAMMIAIQKFRSAVLESCESDVVRKVTIDLFPWILGDRCPLPALVKILDRDEVVPMNFYNMMYILERFLPEVKIGCEHRFPQPDTSWVALRFSDKRESLS